MTKANRMMLQLIFMSYFGAILGAYFKINGNPNGDYILIAAIGFKFLGVLGLVYFNKRKILQFLS